MFTELSGYCTPFKQHPAYWFFVWFACVEIRIASHNLRFLSFHYLLVLWRNIRDGPTWLCFGWNMLFRYKCINFVTEILTEWTKSVAVYSYRKINCCWKQWIASFTKSWIMYNSCARRVCVCLYILCVARLSKAAQFYAN